MAKTYDHAVIYHGVFYDAGTPIEEEAPKPAEEEPKKAKGKGGAKK